MTPIQKSAALDGVYPILTEEQKARLFDTLYLNIDLRIEVEAGNRIAAPAPTPRLVRRMPRVGETVTIRQWGDMVDEFGVDMGAINTGGWLFVEEMKDRCEKSFKVVHADISSFSIEGDDCCYTPEMIEDLPEIIEG